MRWGLVTCILLSFAGLSRTEEEEAVVEEIKDEEVVEVTLEGLGKLKGKTGEARNNAIYYQFLGVPFAAPPLGANRFKPPAPVEPWEGFKDATDDGRSCVQVPYLVPDKIVGSEDCLYLNVFTKSLDASAKKPVVVFIHGGSFIFGSGSIAKGDYVMEEDIVFVSIQYRLGPFGFLTTADSAAPGNYGLHDQLAALKWIQKHIAQFGGDPDSVTITGMSAGGASVNYLMLSPQGEGLFHRAVSMSGSALSWWANIPNQDKTARQLGTAMNCPMTSSEEMLECLREKPAKDIMIAQGSLYAWHHDRMEKEPMNIWSPRPDLEAKENAVLPIEPHLAMQVGQIQPVPFLVGVAESEGLWRAANYLTQDDVMVEFVKSYGEIAPYALGLVGQVNEGQMKPVLKKIRDYYLSAMTKEEDLKKRLEKVVYGMNQMLGDTMFNYPIDRMVKMQGNKEYSPVWMYQYNYKHNHSMAFMDVANPGKVFKPDLIGFDRSTHCHELSMLFPAFEDMLGPLSEEETKQSRKFVKFIAEFARQGHPKMDGKYEFSEWEPVADGQLTHFVFGKYSATQKGLPFQHRMKWWNNMPVYWKKDSAPQLDPIEDSSDVNVAETERYAADVEEISEDAPMVAEELTPEELDELEVSKVAEQMKDEL